MSLREQYHKFMYWKGQFHSSFYPVVGSGAGLMQLPPSAAVSFLLGKPQQAEEATGAKVGEEHLEACEIDDDEDGPLMQTLYGQGCMVWFGDNFKMILCPTSPLLDLHDCSQDELMSLVEQGRDLIMAEVYTAAALSGR